MGPFDRDILSYVGSCNNECCLVDELLAKFSSEEYTIDHVIHDINQMIAAGLFQLSDDRQTIHLLPKAKQPPVPIAPDRRK